MQFLSSLYHRDLQSVWHPASQMKDYETFKPLIIKRAHDCYIETIEGKKIIDAISSWWCKLLGHQHPRLKAALLEQLKKFEHVLLANTTYETIVELSEKLSLLMKAPTKVFYAGDGSSAVEIALKMSLHARRVEGDTKRNRLLALENAYHGETIGALSVSDVGIYRAPYEAFLFNTYFISSLPYVKNKKDPLWLDCGAHWEKIEKNLAPYAETATALIVEPIVQGAGGMKIYSQDFLKRLRNWSRKHHIHFIADEIMTGLCRTGKLLACHYAGIEPDFLCLSKGLTGGFLPFSAVLIQDEIYKLFYNDYDLGKSFLHSHTYSGNALGASVALQVLKVIEEEKIAAKALALEKKMLKHMQSIADETGKIKNVRGMGAIVAADLICDSHLRMGFEVYQQAVKLGALLRPLGNTLYWLPPLTMQDATLNKLKMITQQAIIKAFKYNRR